MGVRFFLLGLSLLLFPLSNSWAEALWDPEKAVLVQRLTLNQDDAKLSGKVYLHTLSPLKVELKIDQFNGDFEKVVDLVGTWTRKKGGMTLLRKLGHTSIQSGRLRLNGKNWAQLTAQRIEFRQGEVQNLELTGQGKRWSGHFERLRLTESMGPMNLPPSVFPLVMHQVQGKGNKKQGEITLQGAQSPLGVLKPMQVQVKQAQGPRYHFHLTGQGGEAQGQKLWPLLRQHGHWGKRLKWKEDQFGVRDITLKSGTLKLTKIDLKGLYPPLNRKTPLKDAQGMVQFGLNGGVVTWVGGTHLAEPFKGPQRATINDLLVRLGVGQEQLTLQSGSAVLGVLEGVVKLKSIRPAQLYPGDSNTVGFRADLQGVHLTPWRWQGHLTRTGGGGMPYSLKGIGLNGAQIETAGVLSPLWQGTQLGAHIDAAYFSLRGLESPLVVPALPLPLQVSIKRLGCGAQAKNEALQWQTGKKPLVLCQR
ncbi:hypothetical protein [Magnetococcus sp. PR-3]|uniref:hypothetical protein n=1 Tax=Magnetococcus sp. PR-3 TaxID=3120355 RepID=UPI002FCE2D40